MKRVSVAWLRTIRAVFRKARRDAEARSWLMNAVINANAEQSGNGGQRAGHQGRTVHAPVLIHILGRAHRRRNGPSIGLMVFAGLIAVALLIGF